MPLLSEAVKHVQVHSEMQATRSSGFEALTDDLELLRGRLEDSQAEVSQPMSDGIRTVSELMSTLQRVDDVDLFRPSIIEYIHFLHRILMMGIEEAKYCGVFRKKSVNVGNPELVFPPPCALSHLMFEFSDAFHIRNSKDPYPTPLVRRDLVELTRIRKQFYETKGSGRLKTPTPDVAVKLNDLCESFGRIRSSPSPSTLHDQILRSARVSHRFVCIHPYRDGNGRVSRLLMNLALLPEHPPVYLKADTKGRHRYIQALRRADRGNLNPLACLIAINLIEIYEIILKGLEGDRNEIA